MIQTIYPVYKPLGVSSFDIIKQLRNLTGVKKIGHAGTLDPLAEGVLVVGITRQGTKQLHQLLQCDKDYFTEIKLGATTETGDSEGKEQIVNSQLQPELSVITQALKKFKGEILQTPHQYSAVKIDGTPAYKLARQGKKVDLKPKKAEIHSINIQNYQYPFLRMKVRVGSGVYIRSLARDLGVELGTGAYLTKLVRQRVGEFYLNQALTVRECAQSWNDRMI